MRGATEGEKNQSGRWVRAPRTHPSAGTQEEQEPDPTPGLEANSGKLGWVSRVGRCGKGGLWAERRV